MKNIILISIMLAMLMMLSNCATSRYYKLQLKEFSEFDYGFNTHKVKIRNINISIIDEGDSEQAVVLVHGLGSNAKGWIKNIPVLAEKYRVIALDLAGYGKSDKGYFQYTMPFHAQIIIELLDSLKIEKAGFIGHSMGGQISMITALSYPQRVEKLVLISPAGFEKFTDGEGAWMMKAVTPELIHDTPIRNIDINLKSNFYKTPSDAEFMITERIEMRGAKDFDLYCYAVSKNVAGMLEAPVWDKLDKIQQPTLIMFGENDALIPNPYLHGGNTVDIAKIGGEKIPDSKLIMVPECGHFVQFEKADETNKAILEFLDQQN